MVIKDEEWKAIKDYVDWIFDKTQADRDKMTSMYDHFVGDVWDEEKLEETDSRAFVNIFFSNVESSAPMITDSNPVVQVIPRWAYLGKLRESYNKAFKYFWNIADMQMKLFMGTLDSQIMNIGIYEITYDEENPFESDISVRNVDPRVFFSAPGYDEIWDSPICGTREQKPIGWIKKRFPKVKNVKPEESILGDVDAFKYGEAKYYDMESCFKTVYRVWIKDDETSEDIMEQRGEKEVKVAKLKYPNGKFMYFTNDEFLACEPSPFQHGLPPFVEQWNYRVPHRLLGISEGDQIIGLQKEVNLNYQRVVRHAKKFHNPNILIDTSYGVDVDDVKEKYYEGGNAWGYDGFASSQREPVMEIKGQPLDPSITGLIGLSRDLIEDISGMTDIARGQVGKKDRQSATEIGILTESAHTRTRQKVRNLEWTIKRVGYQVTRIMQQYYLEPRSIYFKDDKVADSFKYDSFGTNVAQVADMLRPSKTISSRVGRILSNITPETKKRYEQEEADFAKFIQVFAPNGEAEHANDPVFFDFDLVVETNSTLPMDKQSLANLFVRLFQYKAIDAQALLERLQIPGIEDIMDRMKGEEERKAELTGRPSRGPRQMPEQPGPEGVNAVQ